MTDWSVIVKRVAAPRCSDQVPPRARQSLPAAKLCYAGNGSEGKKPAKSMADVTDEVPISHLQRRRIESRVLIPFIAACREKFGDAATKELVVATIRRLAVEDGARWAEAYGRDLPALKNVAEKVWAGGGSLDVDMVAAGDDRLDFNVTRCRYAEFYKELGLADLGYLVHCNRDHAMIGGFNPDLKLTRTQTVMEGASHCDFRFTKKT
jgi:hypothetical protein